MKLLLILSIFTSSVLASQVDLESFDSSLEFAQVTKVLATQDADGTWCFGTTVRHNDQGWNHFANGWEVVDLDGKQLAFRQLGHPHDNEQPFTRSQCGINISANVTSVIVRASCNNHGYGGKPVIVNFNGSQGSDYSVKRYK